MIVPNLTEEMVETINDNVEENVDAYCYDDSWLNSFLFEKGYCPDDSRLSLKSFKFDCSNIEKPFKTDYNNAIMLYETMNESVAVFMASSGAFWTALVHANLEYMRYRWPLKGDSEAILKTLKSHYLMQWTPPRRDRERNGLSRLWWIVHLTVAPDDTSLPDKYALTREIMSSQDLMMHILDREQFNPMLTRCFAKVLYKERESGRALTRNESRALLKHIFVLDRVIILYALSEDKIVSRLMEYLNWYRSVDNHLEEEI